MVLGDYWKKQQFINSSQLLNAYKNKYLGTQNSIKWAKDSFTVNKLSLPVVICSLRAENYTVVNEVYLCFRINVKNIYMLLTLKKKSFAIAKQFIW